MQTFSPDQHALLRLTITVSPHRLRLNEEERKKDRLARESVLKSLQSHLRQGEKSLVKNRAFKRFLKKADTPKFEIDWDACKIRSRTGRRSGLKMDILRKA